MKFNEQESSALEFERELPKNDQIIKTVVGFCNHNGGRLIIGVDDDGTIIGIDDAMAQHVLEYLEKSIYEASAPPIIPRVYAQRIGEKTILVIEVSSGMNKPYFIASEGLEKGAYVRLGRNTVRANADFIEELKWQSRGRSYDAMPVYHATLDDLDQSKIRAFLEIRTHKKRRLLPMNFCNLIILPPKSMRSGILLLQGSYCLEKIRSNFFQKQ